MKRLRLTHGIALLALWSSAGSLSLHAQVHSSHKVLLEAELKPGQTLRYEIEATGSFLPISDAVGAMLNPPRGPCDYALASIVTLHPQPPDKDGNIPVEARYSETRTTSVRCSLFSEGDFEKRVAALQSRPVMFVIGPHGETAMSKDSGGYFKYWDGGELLHKVTQDLLQTEFAPQPVAEGASWKPRGQFAYSRDHALKDLEPGMVCPGIVTNVTNFGAFVDIGVHQDGLVHISQLADRFVKDPREVVSPGDRVTVRVLEVKREKNQIALTMKAERPQGAAASAPRAADAPSNKGPSGGGGGGKARFEKSAPAKPGAPAPFNNPFAALDKLRRR